VSNHADFDHDHLGHLLMDKRLAVPNFQRPYSWDHNNIEEFWEDLQRARESGSYFMGTIVLANDASNQSRQLVIDGQQRITSLMLLLKSFHSKMLNMNQDDPNIKGLTSTLSSCLWEVGKKSKTVEDINNVN